MTPRKDPDGDNDAPPRIHPAPECKPTMHPPRRHKAAHHPMMPPPMKPKGY